jgi:hypothetical protein
VVAKIRSLRPPFLAVEVHSGRACIQDLAKVLSSGFGNQMKDYEIRTPVLRTVVHIEAVMVRDSESIVGMVSHHGMKKVMATLTS